MSKRRISKAYRDRIGVLVDVIDDAIATLRKELAKSDLETETHLHPALERKQTVREQVGL